MKVAACLILAFAFANANVLDNIKQGFENFGNTVQQQVQNLEAKLKQDFGELPSKFHHALEDLQNFTQQVFQGQNPADVLSNLAHDAKIGVGALCGSPLVSEPIVKQGCDLATPLLASVTRRRRHSRHHHHHHHSHPTFDDDFPVFEPLPDSQSAENQTVVSNATDSDAPSNATAPARRKRHSHHHHHHNHPHPTFDDDFPVFEPLPDSQSAENQTVVSNATDSDASSNATAPARRKRHSRHHHHHHHPHPTFDNEVIVLEPLLDSQSAELNQTTVSNATAAAATNVTAPARRKRHSHHHHHSHGHPKPAHEDEPAPVEDADPAAPASASQSHSAEDAQVSTPPPVGSQAAANQTAPALPAPAA